MKRVSPLGVKDVIFNVTAKDRIISAAFSKGNQRKWKKDGKYIKADYLGYEGLAECFVSEVAFYSNLSSFSPITYYYLCEINEDGKTYTGCYSENFLNRGQTLLTLSRLLLAKNGSKALENLEKLQPKDRIKATVDTVISVTGLNNFGEWLTCLLEFDALVLNEDRHFNNIAVIMSEIGEYELMPLFDNGAALLSDTTTDYPLTIPQYIAVRNVKAKPFNKSFTKQIRFCQELYGEQLSMNLRQTNDKVLDSISLYSTEVKDRVYNVFKQRLEKFNKDRDFSTY